MGSDFPSVGRIVHFWRQGAGCTAAIIVKVNTTGVGEERKFTSNLMTFEPTGGTRYEENIPEGNDVDTWHWPERT